MAEVHIKHHDYHLVDPSPWPAVGSISAFIAAVGGISWMHHMFAGAPFLFGIGVIGILYTFLAWWRDVVKEAQYEGFHTRVVQISHRYGMILFIASEVMFFVAWFWAYFNTALFPDAAPDVARVAFTGGVWPPKGIETFDPWHLPLLNTLILLTSGTTVTWAHHALLEDDRQGLKWGLILTIALGITFTCVQAWEYSHAAFNFKGNIYGATFFMATGFHGAHVIIGTIFLTVCLIRAVAGHFSPKQHLGFEFAAWYWHFVDVVWLFLFACIYVWGAGGEHVAAAPRSEVVRNEVQPATGAPAANAQSFERLLATASAERGAQVVKQCQICHNTEEGQGPKVGPDLYGVVDRPVASVPGFNYTPALKAKGGKWTFAELNKWITNPRADVPGTSMTFAGLSNEKQRADLIAYLDTLSKNPVPLPKAESQK